MFPVLIVRVFIVSIDQLCICSVLRLVGSVAAQLVVVQISMSRQPISMYLYLLFLKLILLVILGMMTSLPWLSCTIQIQIQIQLASFLFAQCVPITLMVMTFLLCVIPAVIVIPMTTIHPSVPRPLCVVSVMLSLPTALTLSLLLILNRFTRSMMM
jgi:hypothetical protein